MNILVLSFYFRPDLSAGSFRTTALVEALQRVAPPGSQVDVITTRPNRYQSYFAHAEPTEASAGLSIVRIPLRAHKSGMLDQSRAFLAFARGAIRQVSGRDYELVYATSSRLMTAALGAHIATRKKARLYLDIRDIFVDTIRDVMPGKLSWIFARAFSLLERRAIRRADKVNLVSAGFADYFRSKYPRQLFSFYTNGIDDEFMAATPTAPPARPRDDRPLTIVYAGNIGEGQGLHNVVPRLANAMGSRVRFKIIGDGGRKPALEAALAMMHATNVELLAPMGRNELIDAYQGADVLFLHLNNHVAFKKVLPSKVFEYAALGKPVWAGVAGYAADFVRAEISNAAVFSPCDVPDAIRVFGELTIEDTPRVSFIFKYGRARISQMLANDVLAVARGDH